MVRIILIWKPHYYDKLNSNEQERLNANRKFDQRKRVGDIHRITRDVTKAVNVAPENIDNFMFRAVDITDLDYEDIIQYQKKWQRTFTGDRILNDTVVGQFEYRLSIVKQSKSLKELIDLTKENIKKPEWVYIKSITSESIEIGFYADNWKTKNATTYEEKRNLFQQAGYQKLGILNRTIAQARYYFDGSSFPQKIINDFNSEDTSKWIAEGTWSQLQPYLKDKWED